MKRLFLIPLLVLALPLWLSCGGKEGTPSEKAKNEGAPEKEEVTMTIPEHLHHYELKLKLRKYAQVNIDYDQTVLSDPEKEALGKLVHAARVMDDIFLRQVWSGNAAMQASLNELHLYSHQQPYSKIGDDHDLIWDLIRFSNINFGPWDRLTETEFFIGSTTILE